MPICVPAKKLAHLKVLIILKVISLGPGPGVIPMSLHLIIAQMYTDGKTLDEYSSLSHSQVKRDGQRREGWSKRMVECVLPVTGSLASRVRDYLRLPAIKVQYQADFTISEGINHQWTPTWQKDMASSTFPPVLWTVFLPE